MVQHIIYTITSLFIYCTIYLYFNSEQVKSNVKHEKRIESFDPILNHHSTLHISYMVEYKLYYLSLQNFLDEQYMVLRFSYQIIL